ncbi:MAG: hypothetical protein M0P73_10720 [Syntrophobacterales bacterium]|nr:hypothetical protein [Syntrophobacterales bacterium]
MMTQGIIVYLLGGGEPPEGVIPATHYQELSQSGAPLEIVVSQPGILELDDAWHFLLARGCEPIHLLVTQAEQDRLRPLYPLVRLTGITRVTEDLAGAGSQRRVLH